MHRAITRLVGLARRNRVPLRQSYLRLAKRAAIMVGRYTHAHQFKRARRQLKFLRTRLGRIIRDICRKIDGNAVLEAHFGPLLGLAQQVRSQFSISAVQRSMRYMPRRSSASARVRPARLTSSAARSVSPPP